MATVSCMLSRLHASSLTRSASWLQMPLPLALLLLGVTTVFAQSSVDIYTDALPSNWQDWSWSLTRTIVATDPSPSGAADRCIQVRKEKEK